MQVKVGRTPSRVAWREGASSLRSYGPAQGKPLLLVYAMVNKPFILDLLPGLSVIERLANAGRRVYLLDWGTPRPADKDSGLEHYVAGVLDRAVDAVRRRHGGKAVHLAGYCQGGVYSLLYTALHPAKVRTLGLFAAPVDYTRMGTLSVWARRANLDVDRLVGAFGNVPGAFLYGAFEALKPYASLRGDLGHLSALWTKKLSAGQQDHYLALERWKKEHVDHPGAAFREVVRGLFQENRLAKNAFKVGRRVADVKKVRCPVFVAVGERDHLVPPAAAVPVVKLVSSRDIRVERVPVGHIGLSVSGRSHKELWPRYSAWLEERD